MESFIAGLQEIIQNNIEEEPAHDLQSIWEAKRISPEDQQKFEQIFDKAQKNGFVPGFIPL